MTKQINVGLSGSASSSEAVHWAAAEAAARGALLRIISCYPVPIRPGAGGIGFTTPDDYASVYAETRERLVDVQGLITGGLPGSRNRHAGIDGSCCRPAGRFRGRR